MKKKVFSFVAAAIFAVILFSVTAYADAVHVAIEGVRVVFADQRPAIIDGRTLVPVRGVFEHLGFEVSWDNDARAAILNRADFEVIITLGSDVFTTNGTPHMLEVPAQSIGGRTMLPIRAVLESVGYFIGWDNDTRTVLISSAPIVQPEPIEPQEGSIILGDLRLERLPTYEFTAEFLRITPLFYAEGEEMIHYDVVFDRFGRPDLYGVRRWRDDTWTFWVETRGFMTQSRYDVSRTLRLTLWFYDSANVALGSYDIRTDNLVPGERFNINHEIITSRGALVGDIARRLARVEIHHMGDVLGVVYV